VRFERFESERAQYEWLVEQICANLGHDELRHDDIIVIHPDPLTARQKTGPIRKTLFERGVQNHLAGVDTVADVFFQTETPSVTFTGIYRAKGNEAGMVYVIDAQDCDRLGVGLSSLRNRLFTAMTRSKAWVRVVGVGPRMQNLVDEFERLKINVSHSISPIQPMTYLANCVSFTEIFPRKRRDGSKRKRASLLTSCGILKLVSCCWATWMKRQEKSFRRFSGEFR
jgi:superfamily I DNA and RNA helicase